jgi:ABC-type spermidine/putrescine transport system permease subunit I
MLLRVSLYEGAAGEGFYRPGTWSAHAYSELIAERLGRGIIAFTAALGAGVAALAVVIGYPIALVVQSFPRRLKQLALGVVRHAGHLHALNSGAPLRIHRSDGAAIAQQCYPPGR